MRAVLVISSIAVAGVIAYTTLPLGGNDPIEVSAATIPGGALATTPPQRASKFRRENQKQFR